LAGSVEVLTHAAPQNVKLEVGHDSVHTPLTQVAPMGHAGLHPPLSFEDPQPGVGANATTASKNVAARNDDRARL
jgi:hypothetical protein